MEYTDRQTGRQTDIRQAGRQTDIRQAGRQAGRQTDRPVSYTHLTLPTRSTV